MKEIKLEPVNTIMGRPFRIPDLGRTRATGEVPETVETTALVDLLRVVIFSLPAQKLTMKDSVHGSRLYSQLNEATKSLVVLEDDEYTWIVQMVGDYGANIFGVNAIQLKDALENFRYMKKKEIKARNKAEEQAEEPEQE